MHSHRCTAGRSTLPFAGFLTMVLWAGVAPVRAQSGLAVPGLQPAAGATDLLATRSPAAGESSLSLALGTAWAWGVLSATGAEQQNSWTVKQRLMLYGGLEAAVGRRLRLGIFAAGAAWQQGTRTDAWGEPGPLSAGMGETWLAARASLVEEDSFGLGTEFSLRLPSADAEALAGEPSAGSRFAVLAETRWGPLRTLLNAALVVRRRTVFYDLESASAWQAVAGLEAAPEGWALTPALELFFERSLSPAAGYRSASLMVLGGGHLALGAWRLSLGAAAGLLGAGAPAPTVIFRLGWRGGKCRSLSE